MQSTEGIFNKLVSSCSLHPPQQPQKNTNSRALAFHPKVQPGWHHWENKYSSELDVVEDMHYYLWWSLQKFLEIWARCLGGGFSFSWILYYAFLEVAIFSTGTDLYSLIAIPEKFQAPLGGWKPIVRFAHLLKGKECWLVKVSKRKNEKSFWINFSRKTGRHNIKKKNSFIDTKKQGRKCYRLCVKWHNFWLYFALHLVR